MARLRLNTRIPFVDSHRYPGTGETVVLPSYRLHLKLHFVPPDLDSVEYEQQTLDQSRRFSAIVDTGASLTNLPYEIWEPFAAEIRWLDPSPASVRLVSIGGSTASYQLGRIRLMASDIEGRHFPAEWTVARCLHFTEEPMQALLGLYSPFLMNRRILRHNGNARRDLGPPEWWLEDPR